MSELDKVEIIKKESNFLRGSIAKELNSNEDGFSEENKVLLKFHGMYQQRNRDRSIPDEEKINTFMIRGRIAGGRLNHAQYLVWNDLAEKFGSGTFRLTTRQTIQLHHVTKPNLKSVLQAIDKIDQTTMATCGDVVRNVTQSPNPLKQKELDQLDEIASQISNHFKYYTNAYTEIWLDGEQINSREEEPIYSEVYLPRKFKIAVTLVGNNTVDIYTNDLGFAGTLDANGQIDGYFVFVGGGMGMSHNKPNTFPRLADEIGWIEKKDAIKITEEIVKIHRDYGDRTNRKHARLKYVLHDKGIDWFKIELETRSKIKLIQKKLPQWNTPDYLGWNVATDGSLSLGIHTLSGRISDFEDKKLKTAIKEVVGQFKLNVMLTADQDMILLGVPIVDKEKIIAIFNKYNVQPEPIHSIYKRAISCVALPTCGLALTEAERIFPSLLEEIHKLLDKLAITKNAPVLRVTGCPNGCARPYAAEIALVGQVSGGKYALYIGGNAEGTRLATQFAQKLSIDEVLSHLESLFVEWKANGLQENFGDFVSKKLKKE